MEKTTDQTMKEYFAHKSDDGMRLQTVREHLLGTAGRAEEFASAFGCGAWGYGCGLAHDVGKFSVPFQKRLNGGSRPDHSTAGAQELKKRHNYMAAYCVAGHHTGLPDGGTFGDAAGESTLMGRLKKDVPDYAAFAKEIQIPSFPPPPLKPIGRGGFSVAFFIRMLFSCLVDADRLDTEAFMTEGTTKREEASFSGQPVEILYERLHQHIKGWLANQETDTVNGRRSCLLRSCLEQGTLPMGLYGLTIPTGGGKTITSLAFALKHAMHHHLRRVIYVIPYTGIIEQNARIFRDILGKENVLEDHSNVVIEDREELELHQMAAENWDRPVIVTTNVQFFESLFSASPSRCRKLHRIAESVIIFDEAQMLPAPYLKPCVRAIAELVRNYRCTALICTATQPALQKYFPENMKIRELCPDVEEQFRFFRRNRLENVGRMREEELVDRLRQHTQALCILNGRKRVQRVFEALKEEGTYHLSTLMYPAHRKRMLEEIRDRLKQDLPCRLIATSLVEAGVDFDFPAVYREAAGLDSVIQAAGRCNREGKRDPRESRVVIFRLEGEKKEVLPAEMRLPVSVAEQIMEEFEDLSSPQAVYAYFNRLFDMKEGALDAEDIIDSFERGTKSGSYPFAEVSKRFHLIEDRTVSVFIGKEAEAEELLERLKRGECSRRLLRDAGQYCVSIYESDRNALSGTGLLEPVNPCLEMMALKDTELYRDEMGLVLHVTRGDAVFG